MVGLKIREARHQKGWSQAKLAKEIDVSRSLVMKWEKGGRSPREAELRRVSKALELPLTYFMDDDGAFSGPLLPSEVAVSSNCLVYEANGERVSIPATPEGYEFFWKLIADRGAKK